MSIINAIQIIRPDQFDLATAQTPGSERRAAIAPELGVKSSIWGGIFEVEPGSRTGVHHHGPQETIAFVLRGACEIRWGTKGEFVGHAKPGDFIHVPAYLPHMEQSIESARVPVGCCAEHADADRRESSECGLAVSYAISSPQFRAEP